MTTVTKPPAGAEDELLDKRQPGPALHLLQHLGALLITALALILLFGVPARLLFGIMIN